LKPAGALYGFDADEVALEVYVLAYQKLPYSNGEKAHCLFCGVSSLVSISSELESESESALELSESEESEETESSTSSFVFDAPFMVCFCLLSGSGDVDRLELLSLSEEDEAAMVCFKMTFN